MADDTKTTPAPSAPAAATPSPAAGKPAAKPSPNPAVPTRTSGGPIPMLSRQRKSGGLKGRGIMSRKAYDAAKAPPPKEGSHEAQLAKALEGLAAPDAGARRALHACAAQREKWAPGQEVDPKDFDKAMTAAGSIKISAR